MLSEHCMLTGIELNKVLHFSLKMLKSIKVCVLSYLILFTLATEDKKMDTSEAKTVPPGKRRAKCQYWAKCYRKDEGHKKLYIHPGDPDENQAAAGQSYSNIIMIAVGSG